MAVGLQILTTFAYEWVASSWMVATIILKEVLILHIAKLFLDEQITLEHFGEVVMRYSKLTVTVIVALGLAAVAIGFRTQAQFLLFSQLVAIGYFCYLFWKF